MSTAHTDASGLFTDRTLIITGIGVSIVTGFGGVAMPAASPEQAIAWTLAALGLLMAAVLLGIRSFRTGYDLSVAGFAIIALHAIGDIMAPAITTVGFPEISSGAYVSTYAVLALGLLLIGISEEYRRWIRAGAVVAAIAFAGSAVLILYGIDVEWPLAMTFSIGSRLLLIVVMVGWVIDVWND